jgi:hypothetical protein
MTNRMCCVAMAALALAGTALAQDEDVPLQNWTAPPYWTPPRLVQQAGNSGQIEAESQGMTAQAQSLPSSPLPFVAITPCRIVDTRVNVADGFHEPNFSDDETRTFDLPTSPDCTGLPSTAGAWSLNVQFRPISQASYITLFPTGISRPLVSTTVATPAGFTTDAAIVPAGTSGDIDVYCQYAGRVVIDINGYYASQSLVSSLNTKTGDLTLAAGSNVTITPGTNTLTIAATGSALTLPYTGSAATGGTAFSVSNTGTGLAIHGTSVDSAGIYGTSTTGNGVAGASQAAGVPATYGENDAANGIGVEGAAPQGIGVQGSSSAIGYPAVTGENDASAGIGVRGVAPQGTGVQGSTSASGYAAVAGQNNASAGVGVSGSSVGTNGVGVQGLAGTGNGVVGYSSGLGYAAVYGSNDNGYGVAGYSKTNSYAGVYGNNTGGNGVQGNSSAGSFAGVAGYTSTANGYGIYGQGTGSGYAGFFQGTVNVTDSVYTAGLVVGYETVSTDLYDAGDLNVYGNKNFLIDDPLDPANKELVHAAVESDEVLDQYSGNVVTDADGRAVVALPAWFEKLNTDFRYQLTVIGHFAQAIVEQEIADNRFTIRTNLANVKVSWQVTARRNDAWRKAHPFVAERGKPAAEQGTYMHPELFGQPATASVEWVRHPGAMRRLAAERANASTSSATPSEAP